ncbi:pilus assembly protein TadG-related protein [Rubellimicrobium rubrum]|nr:pilus assembly protein TadG-related protein [Rubellimicrobium rubrum]
MRRVPGRLTLFAREEGGGITVWALFMFLATLMIGAVGVDVTHFYEAKAQLQVAADVAAHAALFRRQTVPVAQARVDAIDRAKAGMPESLYGEVIKASDITFGTYDPVTRVFRPDPTATSAVRVNAGRTQARGNTVEHLLFRVLDLDPTEITAQSIFYLQNGRCLYNGFVSRGVVDIQSQNQFWDGFCLHSNDYVSLNSQNFFQQGTTVSMPDLARLDIPESGFKTNRGLQDALRSGRYELNILDRLTTEGSARESLWVGLQTRGSADWNGRGYLTSQPVQDLGTGGDVTYVPSQLPAGRVYRRMCGNAGDTLTLPGGVYADIVLLTNCQIQISGKVDLQQVVLYTTNTAAMSVKVNKGGGGQTGLWLGKDDACAAGGEAQIITHGGFHNAAGLTMNGGQIIAAGDVNFAADAEGVGAAIVAGGTIDGTSNIDMRGCSMGMDKNFMVAALRMAG